MAEDGKCPRCGAELPIDAPAGLCPRCLMQMGFESGAGDDAAAKTKNYQPRFVSPTPEELAPHFPQLEILEPIGHGGMGVVYKARQKDLDRLVALKILRPDIETDPAFAERFQREARALAKLNHPSIVTVHDFGRKDGLFYFVMEYIDGTNLRELERKETLQPKEALAIIPQVCEALQYAHDQGVVHRDIKPENVLIDTEGRVKIADFGLAKIVGGVPDEAELTGTWQVMGTAHYMAPEQMQGAPGVDHRADIYSLGVVLYEMLTGDLPVGEYLPASKKVHVDVRLDEVVLRAMQRQPERRYQRATDLKTDVETVSRSGHADETPSPETDAAREAIRDDLKVPAIGLFITGAIELSLGIILAGIAFTAPGQFPPMAIVGYVGPFLLFGTIAVTTSYRLRKLRRYTAALWGCILCALPFSYGWFARIVFVVLALLSLGRREVKAAFGNPPQARP